MIHRIPGFFFHRENDNSGRQFHQAFMSWVAFVNLCHLLPRKIRIKAEQWSNWIGIFYYRLSVRIISSLHFSWSIVFMELFYSSPESNLLQLRISKKRIFNGSKTPLFSVNASSRWETIIQLGRITTTHHSAYSTLKAMVSTVV